MSKLFKVYQENIGLYASICIWICAGIITLIVAQGLKVTDFVYQHFVKYEQIGFCVYDSEERSKEPLRITENLVYDADDEFAMDPTSNVYKDNNIVYIYGRTYIWDFYKMADHVVTNDGFKKVLPEDSDTRYGYFEAEKDGALLVIEVPVINSTCISVEKNDTKQNLHIFNADNTVDHYIVNTAFQEEEGKLTQKFYFFSEANCKYLIKYFVLCYLVLFIGSLLVSYLMYVLLFKVMWKWKVLTEYNPRIIFLCLFGIQMLYTCIFYFVNPDNYAVSGMADAYYYMSPETQTAFLDDNGMFSWDLFFQNSYSHRGYFPIFLSMLFNKIGGILGWNPMIFQFLFTTAVSVSGCCIALPMIYEFFTGKKPKNISIIIGWLIFAVFWDSHFFYVLSDIPSAMFGLLALAFSLRMLKSFKWQEFLLAGVFWGLASAYRAAYGYLIKLILAVVLVLGIIKAVRENKKKIKELLKSVGKTVLNCGIMVLGIVIIMSPQLYINIQKNHISLFPYQSVGSYSTVDNAYQTFRLGSILNYKFMKRAYLDEQMNAIWRPYFTDEKSVRLTPYDAAYVVSGRPVEFSVAMVKKLFYALSYDGERVYDNNIAPFILRSGKYFLNYTILGFFLLCMFKKKNIKLHPKYFYLTFGIVASLMLIVQVAMFHVEERYYMLVYMLLYFYFAYFGMDVLQEKSKQKLSANDMKFVMALLLFVIVSYSCVDTINANFIKV